ncbi:S8 family serine peptidase [Elizabethkingia sp. JS20170427COW]|uniref:S8 family serine peptidase n=1 Tax=Elizabethkingia sp. JS20170427COW TaxID=2583851 RepID=UPI0011100F1D|nr:S8 family serine peptidase [Elizabethkingia sp. JS20170427COW]QCX53696.1 T9SS type A sorting domain-containing protein [Elizabethkingia sp. JS20170427COW]
MKNNYPRKAPRLLIAVGFLALLSTSVDAQTLSDSKKLKTDTKFSILNKAQSSIKRTVVTNQRLQAFAKQKGIDYQIKTKDGKIMQLVAIEGNGNPIYLTTFNDKAAITSGVNLIRKGGSSQYNLTGKDVNIIEWDGGQVRATHQELKGRITKGEDTGNVMGTISDHATHVAGTVLGKGVNPKAKGMAPESTIVSYDFNDTYNELFASLGKQEGILSTHSYGYGVGWSYNGFGYSWGGDKNVSTTQDYKFGYYSEYDAVVDELLLAAPWHTYVRAAGNDRGEGPANAGISGRAEKDGGETGYDTVGFGSLPKNVIVVGAVEPIENYTGPESVKMTDFSSWGPADDGRILPTVVADGFQVFSSVSTSDTAYGQMSGTSMATPATTGAISLLQEYAKKKTGSFFTSPLVKSIIVNTAKEAGRPGPDYSYGFGLIDAKAAVETVDYKGKSTDYKEGTLKNGETVTLTFETKEGVPFKATLAWLDQPGEPKAWVSDDAQKDSSFLNDRTSKLVDDLDMRVTQDGVEYKPYVLNPETPEALATTGDNVVDNIEQIYIANPKTGTLTLTFTHKGTLNAEVHYGLSVSGLSVSKDLILENLATNVPVEQYGKATPVKVNVANKGTQNMGAFQVKFTVKDPAGSIKSESVKDFSGLAVGETLEANATVDLLEVFTPYTVTAEIISAEDEIPGNGFASMVLTPVVADLREGGSTYQEDFNEVFDVHNWKIIDENADGITWRQLAQEEFALDGTSFAINYAQGQKSAKDWLVSNPIQLKAGNTYKVSYYTMKLSNNASHNENIEVFLGDQASVAGMSQSLNKFTWNQTEENVKWKKVEFTFTAAKDGIQYFGIKHYSNDGIKSYLGAVENFKILNTNEGLPTPEFTYSTVDQTSVITPFTDVVLQNATESNPTVTAWQWEFVPNTVSFREGTTANSENPIVRFNENTTYSIKLKATNANGTVEKNKYNTISVQEPTLASSFSQDRTKVYSKENVQFTNTSVGSPAPQSWKWEITPNTPGAFEFLEGTSATSEHINVKFIKAGDYAVKLTSTSEATTNQVVKESLIKVVANKSAPGNVSGVQKNSTVALEWTKPEIDLPESYIDEGFEDSVFPPKQWQVIDGNSDGNTWNRVMFQEGPITAAVFSFINATGRAVQTDDYLVTPKLTLPKDYTELTFEGGGDPNFPDNIKIYVVKVTDDEPLTAAKIKNQGIKVYDGDVIHPSIESTFNKIDLSSALDGSPVKLAFYSYNKDQFVLSIDDIKISKPGTVTEVKSANKGTTTTTKKGEVKLQQLGAEGKFIMTPKPYASVKPTWESLEVGPTNNVTSYEVLRDNTVIANVDEQNTIYVDNTVAANTTYSYSLVAVYDGVNKSEASQPITVEVGTLGTLDLEKASQIAAYPNPVVDVVKVKFASALSGKAEVELYGMDGKKVFSKSLTEAELSQQGINLSQLNSGAYVLVVKNNNQAFTTKIMKK